MEEVQLLSKPSPPVPAFCWEEGKPYVGKKFSSGLNARENKVVCVTDGNSVLGSHIVKELLSRGYLVRVTVQNQGELVYIQFLGQEISAIVGKWIVEEFIFLGFFFICQR